MVPVAKAALDCELWTVEQGIYWPRWMACRLSLGHYSSPVRYTQSSRCSVNIASICFSEFPLMTGSFAGLSHRPCVTNNSKVIKPLADLG